MVVGVRLGAHGPNGLPAVARGSDCGGVDRRKAGRRCGERQWRRGERPARRRRASQAVHRVQRVTREVSAAQLLDRACRP